MLHGEESVSPATAKNQHGGNLVYSAVPVTPVQATPATQKRQQPSIQANHSQIKQTDYKSRLYTGMHPSVFVLVYVVGWLVSPRSWLVCVITSGCVMFCVFHGDARPPSLSLCNHNVCICKRPRLMHALASWHPVAHTPTSLVHTAANPWQHPLSQSFAAPVFRCRVMESRAARLISAAWAPWGQVLEGTARREDHMQPHPQMQMFQCVMFHTASQLRWVLRILPACAAHESLVLRICVYTVYKQYNQTYSVAAANVCAR